MAKNQDEKGDRTLPSSSQKWVEISPCEIINSEIEFRESGLVREYSPAAPVRYTFQPDYSVFHPPIA